MITAITVEKRSVAEVVAEYGVARSWLYELLARYRSEGEAAFEPRSRRLKTSPRATPALTVELVLALRKQLTEQGLDAGADTIGWHLQRHHQTKLSRATIHRILTRHSAVVAEPGKRPRSSYLRFAAEQPNECWQSDFTHYRLTTRAGRPGADVEIISWLDDHSRYALRSPHTRGSPDRSWSRPSAKPLRSTGSRPPPSPTTGWSAPPACPAGKAAATASKPNYGA
ncbi:helix-turn-helix domain-containing protein [Kribbella sp. NPDC051718]|uniref:helix-turn-helix domain-containing protein n=1 Tax=Kribbella sp. NPDC051718 TaxID=3155168 RepID=UPI00343EA4C2